MSLDTGTDIKVFVVFPGSRSPNTCPLTGVSCHSRGHCVGTAWAPSLPTPQVFLKAWHLSPGPERFAFRRAGRFTDGWDEAERMGPDPQEPERMSASEMLQKFAHKTLHQNDMIRISAHLFDSK